VLQIQEEQYKLIKMSCNKINLPVLYLPLNETSPILKGDTLKDIEFEILTGPENNQIPINLTGATIRIDFINSKFSNIHYLLSSTTNNITITDAVNGLFKINSISRLDWKAGIYIGDLEFTFSDNTRTTYCIIELTVTEDITK
jgi:hypothetical protein